MVRLPLLSLQVWLGQGAGGRKQGKKQVQGSPDKRCITHWLLDNCWVSCFMQPLIACLSDKWLRGRSPL